MFTDFFFFIVLFSSIRDEVNILHAAMMGVTNAIPLVVNIGANLIAFIAAIDLVSHFLDWSCTLVGAEEGTCTLEVLLN